jgi:hypothetical protein
MKYVHGNEFFFFFFQFLCVLHIWFLLHGKNGRRGIIAQGSLSSLICLFNQKYDLIFVLNLRERESFNVFCKRIETRFNLNFPFIVQSSDDKHFSVCPSTFMQQQGMISSFLRFIFVVQVFEPINHSQLWPVKLMKFNNMSHFSLVYFYFYV